MKNNSLLKIASPPIILLIIHVIVTVTGLYDRFWWFDIPMHLLGGILVSISTLVLLDYFSKENKLVLKSLILKFLIILSITTLFAFSWEIMEYLVDFYFNTGLQASLSDTMKDMSMGFIGASVVLGILYIRKLFKL